MSDRLNDRMRRTILNTVIAHAFDEEEQALAEEWKALGDACYDKRYPKAVREKMAALPKGWLPETNHIEVAFGGQQASLSFTDGDRRVQHRHSAWGDRRYSIRADDRLSARFAELDRKQTKFEERKHEAEAQTRAALRSVSTIKKLRKEWPEIAPFTKGLGDTPLLPALPVADLNAMLRLGSAA